jgi:hypothetical protein
VAIGGFLPFRVGHLPVSKPRTSARVQFAPDDSSIKFFGKASAGTRGLTEEMGYRPHIYFS